MTYVILAIAYVLSVLTSRVAFRSINKRMRAEPTVVDVLITLLPFANVILSASFLMVYAQPNSLARKYFGIKDGE